VPDVDEFFDIDRNDFGMNAGAGVMVNLSDAFGVRGDVPYFRDIHESSLRRLRRGLRRFQYWRGAVA
jgi:hypothetical protein